MAKTEVSIFWFRRDLRLDDNTGLEQALKKGSAVLPIFIFDDEILQELADDDPRVTFIYDSLLKIHADLSKRDASLQVFRGRPLEVWKEILVKWKVASVFLNKDYEPYARKRDKKVEELLSQAGIPMYAFKDQVIFEEGEILKNDGLPYHVFTPYKNKWLSSFEAHGFGPMYKDFSSVSARKAKGKFCLQKLEFPTLEHLGLKRGEIEVRPYDLSCADKYEELRNYPHVDGTSRLGPHLRFGTVSVRSIIQRLKPTHEVFLSELIWREFFMQILFHYPRVVHENFNQKYNGISWRNNPEEFKAWCKGQTGYPLVDAGMRELNETGYMHNRVRMITAGFLCKHLLIDWRWGEAYFGSKLLDYELSSNNGNWQWAAGTGCDAAPYFRIFNPVTQLKKFDKDMTYVHKWIPELASSNYPDPIVDHREARQRALVTYKSGMGT
jgi:deoxyribodipyrimidine photo-lyase